MVDEKPTLRNVIEGAIASYCSENGFGLPNSFVYCVSRIDNDGVPVLTLGAMDSQPTTTSMGLAAYLKKSFDMEAESELSEFYYSMNDEDDE